MSLAEYDPSGYVQSGTDWTPVVQGHFLDTVELPKHEILGVPTRTPRQVVEEDFVPTVSIARSIYMPSYSMDETDVFLSAYLWVHKNRRIFDEFTFNQVGEDKIPAAVLANYHTLAFQLGYSDHTRFIDSTKPVAYPLGPDLVADLHHSTLALFTNLRLGVYQGGKKLDPRLLSGSRMSMAITEFYWSGGKKNRWEATDYLTWSLLCHYWLVLGRRTEGVGTDDLTLVEYPSYPPIDLLDFVKNPKDKKFKGKEVLLSHLARQWGLL